ncbi:MAG: PorP/SprF family type IX secretion system membrane protein [Bacteroidales bacterium]|nr:PorP/SprF family type IX secretion system membrane protein [Bacteroidales bacterium]
MKKRIALTYLFIWLYFKLLAQDPHFSQFFVNSLYLSPSYAGSTQGTRLITNIRDQWPGIPGSFFTTTLSLDHFIPSLNSGVGLLLMKDVAGQGHLGSMQIGIQYTYQFRAFRNYQVRPSIHFYRSNRTIDFNRLVFNDQLSLSGIAGGSVEVPPLKQVGYIDFASSILIYSSTNWVGFTWDHMLEPNQSIIDAYSPIPAKYSFFGGHKFYLHGKTSVYNEESINSWIHYRSQGKFDQIDIGAYWTRTPIILGLWYRGIPIFKHYKLGYQNNDAIVIQVGYIWKDIKLGYSYDITISRLIANTYGSHEFSLVYEFNQDQRIRKKTRKVIIPCPKY